VARTAVHRRHCQALRGHHGDQEQTDKVLDAMRKAKGLPDLQHLYCVDMKGLRRYPAGRPAQLRRPGELYAGGRPRDDPQAPPGSTRRSTRSARRHLNILVYTSGTTGPPKGAMLTHRNFIYGAHAMPQPRARPAQLRIGVLPAAVPRGRTQLFDRAAPDHRRLRELRRVDRHGGHNIREIAPTFFLGVPRIWEKLQQNFEFRMKDSGWLQRWAVPRGHAARAAAVGPQGRLEGPALWRSTGWSSPSGTACCFRNMQRHMGLDRTHTRMCGGASVSPETLRFFDIIGLPVGQGYGLTESGGLCLRAAARPARIAGSCGTALPGHRMEVADDGEIFVRRPGSSRATCSTTGTRDVLAADGWLATGDIVETRGDGEVAIVDRKKAIIITSGGKNIAPSEIENALKDSPSCARPSSSAKGRSSWRPDPDRLRHRGPLGRRAQPAVHHLQVADPAGRGARTGPGRDRRGQHALRAGGEHPPLRDPGKGTRPRRRRTDRHAEGAPRLIGKKFARELEQIYGGGTA
jgi:long-chain acyl-CoA synthetase